MPTKVESHPLNYRTAGGILIKYSKVMYRSGYALLNETTFSAVFCKTAVFSIPISETVGDMGKRLITKLLSIFSLVQNDILRTIKVKRRTFKKGIYFLVISCTLMYQFDLREKKKN